MTQKVSGVLTKNIAHSPAARWEAHFPDTNHCAALTSVLVYVGPMNSRFTTWAVSIIFCRFFCSPRIIHVYTSSAASEFM